MDRVVSSERTYEIRHFYDKLSWFPIAELLSILHFVKLSWFPISEYLTILHVFQRSSLKVLIKKIRARCKMADSHKYDHIFIPTTTN